MKTRIELSCTEENLPDSVWEVKALVKALNIVSIELKVFHDMNRNPDKGHSYVCMTNESNPNELLQIYELKKKIAELT